MNGLTSRSRAQSGMTLVELIVVVTIVGILAAIAVPSYRGYVLRVTRTDAKTALTGAAQTLERCFTRENAYNKAACTLAVPFNAPAGSADASRTYSITADITENDFTLTATPQNGQVNDTGCGSFTLNATGKQDIVGGSKTAAECWR